MPNDPRDLMVVWTITYNAPDVPGKYAVRGHDILPTGPRAHQANLFVGDTLEEARRAIPPGMVHSPRSVDDDPVIVESWL